MFISSSICFASCACLTKRVQSLALMSLPSTEFAWLTPRDSTCRSKFAFSRRRQSLVGVGNSSTCGHDSLVLPESCKWWWKKRSRQQRVSPLGSKGPSNYVLTVDGESGSSQKKRFFRKSSQGSASLRKTGGCIAAEKKDEDSLDQGSQITKASRLEAVVPAARLFVSRNQLRGSPPRPL